MKTFQTLTAVGLAAACCVVAVEAASAAPRIYIPQAVKAQSDIVQVRDRYWRGGWNNGYRGYYGRRYYGSGYYNDDWWFPAGAFVAGALIGGAIANSNSYDGYYGDRYYGSGYRYYPRAYYPERVYVAPRRSAYRQGYRDGYRAGYDDGAYRGYRCTPRLADAGNC